MGKNIIDHQGGCACGSIEYRFKGKPVNSVFCYCKHCQLATGSDKWFGLWVLSENFSFTKGSPSTYIRLGDSGEEVIYHFCNNCGTPLCGEVKTGGFYSVSASTVREENSFRPRMAIYVSSAPRWAIFPERARKYDTLPESMKL